jgi:hypothetical protein
MGWSMDDELTPEQVPHRLTDLAGDRAREMSDAERVDLARKIAGHPGYFFPEERDDERAGHLDPATAAEIARLTAELRRTERRMDRLERLNAPSRYQVGSGTPSARYMRLESRARRLERQLRALT